MAVAITANLDYNAHVPSKIIIFSMLFRVLNFPMLLMFSLHTYSFIEISHIEHSPIINFPQFKIPHKMESHSQLKISSSTSKLMTNALNIECIQCTESHQKVFYILLKPTPILCTSLLQAYSHCAQGIGPFYKPTPILYSHWVFCTRNRSYKPTPSSVGTLHKAQASLQLPPFLSNCHVHTVSNTGHSPNCKMTAA